MPAKEFVPWVATAIVLGHSVRQPVSIIPGVDTAGLVSEIGALPALVRAPAS
ncbi:hypothetical protein [Actinomadura alba]|uniref:Uncharacterized protein n=1 Tax=Actinomadura alba TaxID=406431 RepID=A0ABR7LMU9_9ACTN|nr:hypothetical protein [Actinomadura alba]MBC6466104.1 hypothetical protein [Actinomadura alba]